jgi:hypothetical protein
VIFIFFIIEIYIRACIGAIIEKNIGIKAFNCYFLSTEKTGVV